MNTTVVCGSPDAARWACMRALHTGGRSKSTASAIMPPMHRRTKIVCTLGPATATPERIEALVRAGMDVARLNFSHGSHEEHAAVYRMIREASDRAERAGGVLLDLQGPQ